ncbi:MAG: hypothetical protein AAGJ46_02705 [Planctomycetota bacterium]
MAWLIGVDEAGYGPNLGPLVVGASAWRVESPDQDLYQTFGPAVCHSPAEGGIALADSKQLYKPGGGLRLLELGLGAAIGPIAEWSSLIDRLDADPEDQRRQLPWHRGFDPTLPLDADAAEVQHASDRLSHACTAAGVSPPVVTARLVFPAEFNALIEQHGNKGAALSHVTIGLLRTVINRCNSGPVRCILDKHGGRNRYAGLLQHHFPEHWIEPLEESRQQSRYRWEADNRPIEATFRVGGEASLPTALGSMTAKLLRELSMRAFNDFWCSRVEGLKPTAGYPVDAKRFKREIEARQAELGITDTVLWRLR